MKTDLEIVRWPDWKDRQIELLDKADFFDFSQRYSAAEWLRILAEKLESNTSRRMLSLFLNETLSAWRSDFIGRDQLRKTKVDSILRIIFTAYSKGKFDEEIRTVLTVLREIEQNLGNLMPLARAFSTFRRKRDHKMRFYGMCYHYPLFVEGVFDESLRLLFILMTGPSGTESSFADVSKLTLNQLQRKLHRLGLPNDFFWGWNNRIRNSIAHARFRYNEERGMMFFHDIDSYGQQPEYKGWFTIEEFSELESQLNDVYSITQDVIFMLRIHQLVLSPFVPEVGQKLVMPNFRKAIAEGLLEDPNDP